MNADFKKRLKKALELIQQTLHLEKVSTQELYTPVWEAGVYRWKNPMASDGLLVSTRKVFDPPSGLKGDSLIRIGLIIQSEFATSQTKPNPFGKAFIGMLDLGVWVDLDPRERVRLDEVFVLFILPKHSDQKKTKHCDTALANVTLATNASRNTGFIEIDAGAAAEAIAEILEKFARPILKGKGRPKH